jgi:hypothetical protein
VLIKGRSRLLMLLDNYEAEGIEKGCLVQMYGTFEICLLPLRTVLIRTLFAQSSLTQVNNRNGLLDSNGPGNAE